MSDPKIAGIVRDPNGVIIGNAFFNAISAAGDGDMKTLLAAIEEMAEGCEAIPAENALVLVRAAWMAVPPPSMGRPPSNVETRVLRLIDGVAAIEGRPLSQTRSEREIDRCKEEARKAYGPNLEEYHDEVDTE
jgi:hypothetical protein